MVGRNFSQRPKILSLLADFFFTVKVAYFFLDFGFKVKEGSIMYSAVLIIMRNMDKEIIGGHGKISFLGRE